MKARSYQEAVNRLAVLQHQASMSGSHNPAAAIVQSASFLAWLYECRSSKVWSDIDKVNVRGMKDADRG
jgi:hypothetical protein